jgi:hypothetical protein
VGSPPSALGLLGPASDGRLKRAAQATRWAFGTRRRPEPLRASAAVALSVAESVWAVLLHPSMARALGLLCGLAVAGVAAGVLARKFWSVAAGAVLLGAGYLAGQAGRPVSAAVASVFATGLFLICELAWWSEELSARSAWARDVLRRRWALLAGLGGGGFMLGVFAGLAGIAGLGPGTAVAAAGGIGALLGALAVVVWLRELSGSAGSASAKAGRPRP